jgi:hypothetical protein
MTSRLHWIDMPIHPSISMSRNKQLDEGFRADHRFRNSLAWPKSLYSTMPILFPLGLWAKIVNHNGVYESCHDGEHDEDDRNVCIGFF